MNFKKDIKALGKWYKYQKTLRLQLEECIKWENLEGAFKWIKLHT